MPGQPAALSPPPYARAVELKGAPVVILAKTVKGWGLESMAGRNVTHQTKKLSVEELKKFRDSLEIPIKDEDIEEIAPYYHPGEDSEEVRYVQERRKALGGFLPERRVRAPGVELPKPELYAEFFKGSGQQPVATTIRNATLLFDIQVDELFRTSVAGISATWRCR